MSDTPFSPIDAVIEDLAQGRMVIVTDDADRENEGDLVNAVPCDSRFSRTIDGKPNRSALLSVSGAQINPRP